MLKLLLFFLQKHEPTDFMHTKSYDESLKKDFIKDSLRKDSFEQLGPHLVQRVWQEFYPEFS